MRRALSVLVLVGLGFPVPAFATCDEDGLWPAPVTVADPDDLDVARHTVLGIVPDGAMSTVRVRTAITSLDAAAYTGVRGTVSVPYAGARLVDASLTWSEVAPDADTPSDDTWAARMPSAAVPAFLTWLRAVGPRVRFTTATEIPVFDESVHFLDEASEAAWARTTTDTAGRAVYWFDGGAPAAGEVLSGDVVLPAPTDPAFTPVTPYEPLHLTDCAAFPMWVVDVVDGDGTNGGYAGEVGWVVETDGDPGVAERVVSTRIEGSFNTSDRVGPFDTQLPPDEELDEDGASCEGAEVVDPETGEVSQCAFTGTMIRFNLEPASGLSMAGAMSWPRFDGSFTMRIRAGEPADFTMDATLSVDTTLTFDGVYSGALARTEQDLFPEGTLVIPLATVPIGPGELTFTSSARMFAGYEGDYDAGLSWGMSRRDTWVVHAGWQDGAGLSLTSDHETTPLDGTHPRLEGTLRGSLTGFAGMELDLAASESYTWSGLSLFLSGQTSATLEMDASASPLWRIETGGALDGGLEATLLAGLGGTYTLAESELVAWSRDTGADDEGDDPGTSRRWQVGLNENTAVEGPLSGEGVLEGLADGGFLYAGGDTLVRFSADGAIEWATESGGETGGVAEMADGTLLAVAHTCNFLRAFAADGTFLWEKDIRRSGWAYQGECDIVAHTDSGGQEGAVIAGTTSNAGRVYPLVAFFAGDATPLWYRTFDLGEDGEIHGITRTEDGSLFVVGTTEYLSYPWGRDDGYKPSSGGVLVGALDADGAASWFTSVTGNDGHGIVVSDGVVYATGEFLGVSVMALDAVDGTLLWNTTYGEDWAFEGIDSLDSANTSSDSGHDIVALPDGDLLVLGQYGFTSASGAGLLRIRPTGEPVWFWLHDAEGVEGRMFGSLLVSGDGVLAATTSDEVPTKAGSADLGWPILSRFPFDGGHHADAAWASDDRSLQVQVEDVADDDEAMGGAGVSFTPVDHVVTPTDTITTLGPVTASVTAMK